MSDLVTSTDSISKQVEHFPLSGQVLSREEARSRLETLTPGTEEHCQVQNALIRAIGIKEIILPGVSYKINSSSHDCSLLGGFGSSEHLAIGRNVDLKGLPPAEAILVRGDARAFFGHIIALAGDFYGIAGKAISLPGGDNGAKTERFINAFNTLYEADRNQLRSLIEEINREADDMRHASLPHHCYSEGLFKRGSAAERIKKDLTTLLIDNSDHFSNNAKEAYRIGHAAALKKAAEAGRQRRAFEAEAQRQGRELTQEEKDILLGELKLAYAMDAFACHFLTDLFAAGHTRNQRGDLEKFLIERLGFNGELSEILRNLLDWNGKFFAGILTAAQHHQDGEEGLNVRDRRGNQWRAYGDGCFFTPRNAANKIRAIIAVQESVDELHDVYQSNNEQDPERLANSYLSGERNYLDGYRENNTGRSVDELIPEAIDQNSLPLYSIEEDLLVLNSPDCGRETVGIRERNIPDLIILCKKLLDHALKFLPDSYIDSKVLNHFDRAARPFRDRIVLPASDRFWNSFYNITGVYTLHRLAVENRLATRRLGEQIHQLDLKIDELAGMIASVAITVDAILRQMSDMGIGVQELNLHALQSDLASPIHVIDRLISESRAHPDEFVRRMSNNGHNLDQELWEAYGSIRTVFERNAFILKYTEILRREPLRSSDLMCKLKATLFLRRMLNYQIIAFSTNLIVRRLRAERGEIQIDEPRLMREFREVINRQVAAHRDSIDEDLIYESENYINLRIIRQQEAESFENELRRLIN